MKKNGVFLVLAGFVLFGLISCATTPVEDLYPERWEKTYIGMTLEEFRQVWPEAKSVGDDLNNTEIWNYTNRQSFSSGMQVVYFSFRDNKLIQFNVI